MLEFTCACRCMFASLRCMSGILTEGLLHLPFRNLVRFTLGTLVGPPRSPLTSTRAQHAVPPPTFPTSHTHRNALSVPPLSTPILHSAFLCSSENPTAHYICLPSWICVTCHPSFHQPSTTRTRSKVRTKTASCCEAGPRHEADGFLGRPSRLQDLFSSTESLQVARHPLAHDWFQLASKIDSAKPQHKNFRVIRRSGVSRKSVFTARQARDQSLLQSAHPCSATALAESSLDVQVRAEQLSAKQWSRRQQHKTWSLVPCVYKLQGSLWNVPEL